MKQRKLMVLACIMTWQEPESTATWLDWIKRRLQQTMEARFGSMSDAWKTAPIGGEMTSSLAMDYLIKTNIEQTAAMVAESHTTFWVPKPLAFGR